MPPTPLPRRVLLLNWRDLANPWGGGAEVHIWEVFSRAVRDYGWEVRAICAGFDDAPREETVDGIHVHRAGGQFTYNWHAPLAYQRVRRRFRPDVVVDFMNKLPLCSPLYVREPLVCFVHHLFGDAAPSEFSWPVAKAVQGSERFVPTVYRNTPMLVGSESTKSDLVCHGITDSNITVVPYGVDTVRYKPGPKSKNSTLLYVGRLKRYKRIDHLLRAAARIGDEFSELTLDIVGRGDQEKPLRQLANRLGILDRVTFHGYVSENEKLNLYQKAWAVCLPSIKEGFGLVIAEAGLCETPGVGYAVPGLVDAIQDRKTGRLVPNGDEEALESALCKIIADEALRVNLGRAARTRYDSQTWDVTAASTLGFLESVIQQHCAVPSTHQEAVNSPR